MKHCKTLLVALGLCALGAQAQTVTVVLNDGTAHTWPAADIKEITFGEAAESMNVDFPELYVRPYGVGENIGLYFSNEDAGVDVYLDCYAPAIGYFNNGTYVVKTDAAVELERYIDPVPRYTYAQINGVDHPIVAGEMTVSNSDVTYTVNFNFALEDGTLLKGSYVGPFDKMSQVIEAELSDMKVASINDQKPGEIYVKFNDANWTLEGAIDFFVGDGATTLAVGMYTFSDEGEPMTFTSKSYVDIFNPNSNNRLAEGSTILVSENGDNYIVLMDLVFQNGRYASYSYVGPKSNFGEATPAGGEN